MTKSAVKSAYLGWLSAAFAGERGGSSTTAVVEQSLVLGYATGYDVADVAIFIRSLRAYYDGPCALVVDQDPVLRSFMADHGVEALDAPNPPQNLDDWHPHPVVSRFAGFDVLLTARPWVKHALLTDVRDVVFQGDPFAPLLQPLEVYAECDGPLRDHDFNMKYIKAIVGDDIALSLGDQACICVGTVLGQRESLIRLCRLILMLGAIPRSEVGGAFGADQATANLAVHLGLIPAVVEANYSRVATVGLSAPGSLVFEDGKIRNPDGSLSPIVHQHDRHPEILEAIQGLWGRGLEKRVRVKPKKTLADRSHKLKGSIRKRLPELR